MIEQTKTKPRKTLEFKMTRSKQTFSFNPPINLVGKGKWLLAVSLFDCTNSVFFITDENSSFSITIPGHSNSEFAEATLERLNILLEHRSENDIELHFEEVKARGDQTVLEGKEYK